jgi:hypothetical protein
MKETRVTFQVRGVLHPVNGAPVDLAPIRATWKFKVTIADLPTVFKVKALPFLFILSICIG